MAESTDKRELLKDLYYSKLEKYFEKSNSSGTLSRYVVENLIKGVLDWIRKPESVKSTWYMDKYALSCISGVRYKLLMRQHDGRIVTVVPWEDSFNVVWTVHVSNKHANTVSTYRAVKCKYIMESICAEILTQLCYSCNKFNLSVHLSVIEQKNTHQDAFKYVLIYEDTKTEFIQLKPIANLNVQEIVLELVKIFCDIGAPSTIHYKISNVSYLELSQMLNKVWTHSSVHIKSNHFDNSNRLFKIIEILNEWINELPRGKPYYYGWFFVQNRLNNLPNDSGITPFERSFFRYEVINGSKNLLNKYDTGTPEHNIEEPKDLMISEIELTDDTRESVLPLFENNDVLEEFVIQENDVIEIPQDTGIPTVGENDVVEENHDSVLSVLEEIKVIEHNLHKEEILELDEINTLNVNKENTKSNEEIIKISNHSTDSNLNADLDIEVIDQKYEMIVIDDDNDNINDLTVTSENLNCIACKNNARSSWSKCQRCFNDVHTSCTVNYEPAAITVCLPCLDLLKDIEALLKRKEEYKRLLNDMNDT